MMRLLGALLSGVLAGTLLVPAPAAASEVVAFHCAGNGGAVPAMENDYVTAYLSPGPCWGHLGHHTYDLGGTHEVAAVSGRVFTVEVQFSPPTELASPTHAAVVFEASRDGTTWTTLDELPYDLLDFRQPIEFAFDAGGHVARYLRVRQPRSAAQGLSGFLDHSRFDAELGPVAEPAPALALADATRTLGCADDIMERMFPTAHPCWFGGVNRYDGPSFFHTYPLGGTASLDRVSGSVIFLPWRTDDYASGSSRTAITGFVEVSSDGRSFERVATVSGVYGEPIGFDVALDGTDAAFVRLAPEPHARNATHPALKHPRGMIAHSELEVTGHLPQ